MCLALQVPDLSRSQEGWDSREVVRCVVQKFEFELVNVLGGLRVITRLQPEHIHSSSLRQTACAQIAVGVPL